MLKTRTIVLLPVYQLVLEYVCTVRVLYASFCILYASFCFLNAWFFERMVFCTHGSRFCTHRFLYASFLFPRVFLVPRLQRCRPLRWYAVVRGLIRVLHVLLAARIADIEVQTRLGRHCRPAGWYKKCQ